MINCGQDTIDISAFGFSFAQAQANFIQNGNVGAINLGDGDFIVLNGVSMSQLNAADFILGGVNQAAPKASAPVMEYAGNWGSAAATDYTSDKILVAEHSPMPLHSEVFIQFRTQPI